MVNRALLIAYHYPPIRVSSGVQRTLAFSRYLPDYGWEPMVLTPHRRVYDLTGEGQLKDIPEGLIVRDSFALDSARHLAIGGHYLATLALPDRWISWWLGGVVTGLSMIRKYRPKVIWSTYPITTAHLIGLTLHRLTGIPWIADFRDSMTESHYPADATKRRVYRWIERHSVAACSRAVFTTPGAIRMYAARYPDIPAERWCLIPNGYDEEIFLDVEAGLADVDRREGGTGPVVLVHSGILYPSERDPSAFFTALAELKQAGEIDSQRLRVILRASAHDDDFRPMLEANGIADMVVFAPSIEYREALREMMTVDGLLIFQAANCNHQIPAKVYEYLRAGRPILALTDPAGDTATTLRGVGVDDIVPLDDAGAIKSVLSRFVADITAGRKHAPGIAQVQRYSRKATTGDLAELFGMVMGSCFAD